jgi:predicted SPOUT superfamily RNA methylase MTH1
LNIQLTFRVQEKTVNEEISFMPILAGALAVFYVGYEVERSRHKLREIFNVFDKKESTIAQTLERMVESGELRRYVPGSAR